MPMTTFRTLFPQDVAIAESDPRLPPARLLPEEERFVRNAGEGRRREFAAGRAAARRALTALGLPAAPILAGGDRAPVWPEGVVGSISHCETLCLAAVAPAGTYCAIGIDVEPAEALPEDILDTVCTPAEIAWLETRPATERGLWARAIFSVKECAYKCQYPMTGRLIDFHAFEVAIDGGLFSATFTDDVGMFCAGHSLHGRIVFSSTHIETASVLPRRAQAGRSYAA